MVMSFDPFREVNRALEEVIPRRRTPAIAIDAYRRGDEFVVHFDIPGVDVDDIELTTEKNVLTVTAERFYEAKEGDEVLITERPQGRFARQIFLGEGLDRDSVKASYDQGVLTVTIPVAEGAKPRRIQVEGGAGPEAIEADTS